MFNADSCTVTYLKCHLVYFFHQANLQYAARTFVMLDVIFCPIQRNYWTRAKGGIYNILYSRYDSLFQELQGISIDVGYDLPLHNLAVLLPVFAIFAMAFRFISELSVNQQNAKVKNVKIGEDHPPTLGFALFHVQVH